MWGAVMCLYSGNGSIMLSRMDVSTTWGRGDHLIGWMAAAAALAVVFKSCSEFINVLWW